MVECQGRDCREPRRAPQRRLCHGTPCRSVEESNLDAHSLRVRPGLRLRLLIETGFIGRLKWPTAAWRPLFFRCVYSLIRFVEIQAREFR